MHLMKTLHLYMKCILNIVLLVNEAPDITDYKIFTKLVLFRWSSEWPTGLIYCNFISIQLNVFHNNSFNVT